MTETGCDSVAEIAVYQRPFSEIEGLQQAASVRYLLYEQEDVLKIQVERCGMQPRSSRYDLPSLTRRKACGLLQFLYENAVQPENMCDLLEETCG